MKITVTVKKLFFAIACICISAIALPAQAQLDPSFGDGGKVITIIDPLYSNAEFDCVSVLPNGKIIGAGGGYGGRLMVRYFDSGIIDSSFGLNGKCIDSFGGNGVAAMLNLSNGNILAFSHYWERFLPNGQRDSTFGTNGRVTPLFGGRPAMQSDKKIVLAEVYQNIIMIARYHPDGGIDSSFGANGVVTTNFNGAGSNNIAISSILIQSDGKIVVSGDSYIPAIQTYAFIVLRYNTDGSLDTSFNQTGKVYTNIGGGWGVYGRDLKQQPDGKLLQCGAGGLGITLVRYNTNGTLDTTLDHTGIFSINGDQHEAHCMALTPSGNIITAGVNDSNECSIYRIFSNGGIDSSFGTNGHLLTPLDTIPVANPYRVFALHLYNDGRILVGGYIGSEPFLMRYLSDGHATNVETPAKENSDLLKVYPNPADKSVTVLLPDAKGALSVTDVNGRTIIEKTVSGKPLQLDISGFTPGLYFITIKTSTGQIFHARFLKK